jgi:hypothetical protein
MVARGVGPCDGYRGQANEAGINWLNEAVIRHATSGAMTSHASES